MPSKLIMLSGIVGTIAIATILINFLFYRRINELKFELREVSQNLKEISLRMGQFNGLLSSELFPKATKKLASLTETLVTLVDNAPSVTNLFEDIHALLSKNSEALMAQRNTLKGLIDQLDFGEAETLLMTLRAFANRYPQDKRYEAFHKAITKLSSEVIKLVDVERFKKIDQFLDPALREKASLKDFRLKTPEERALEAEKVRILKEKIRYMSEADRAKFEKQEYNEISVIKDGVEGPKSIWGRKV